MFLWGGLATALHLLLPDDGWASVTRQPVPSATARKKKSASSKGVQGSKEGASRFEPDLVSQPKRGQQRDHIAADMPTEVRDYLYKMRNYDERHPSDLVLTGERLALLRSVVGRLDRVQKNVGNGFFYLLSFDEAIRAANKPAVGSFTRAELAFMDEMFSTDAKAYGFLGKKPLTTLTSTIAPREVVKVPGMGNYLYRGEAEAKWAAIQRIMGDQVVLTSGVRGIVKQIHLFLTKANTNGGNLSLASRSLAPPGYSFHGIGDFDVGQRGYGFKNFTADFTGTEVFRQLEERGYITLRYPRDNFLGVRFEPWHVKVART